MFSAITKFFESFHDNNNGWIVKSNHVEHEMGFSQKSIRPAVDDGGVQEAARLLSNVQNKLKRQTAKTTTHAKAKATDAKSKKRKKKRKTSMGKKKTTAYVMKENSLAPVTQLREILYTTMNETVQLSKNVTHSQAPIIFSSAIDYLPCSLLFFSLSGIPLLDAATSNGLQ